MHTQIYSRNKTSGDGTNQIETGRSNDRSNVDNKNDTFSSVSQNQIPVHYNVNNQYYSNMHKQENYYSDPYYNAY